MADDEAPFALLAEDDQLDDSLSNWLLDQELSSLKTTIKKTTAEAITIYIKCVFPDAQDPGRTCQISRSQTCNSTDAVSSVVNTFLASEPLIPQGKQYYLGYDQLLFRDGTLAECGITHGKSVELYAPGKNAAAYHNEGLAFILWGIIPFVIGVACFVFPVTAKLNGDDGDAFSAFFIFLGFVFLIPSILVLTLGLILIPECSTSCYVSGTAWC
jgi:hypothetical protein